MKHLDYNKVMFQMISSGSHKLYHGEKRRGVLHRVNLKSLSSITYDALRSARESNLKNNIIHGMNAIQSQLQDDRTYRIYFTNGALQLVLASTCAFALFPPKDVMERLINFHK